MSVSYASQYNPEAGRTLPSVRRKLARIAATSGALTERKSAPNSPLKVTLSAATVAAVTANGGLEWAGGSGSGSLTGKSSASATASAAAPSFTGTLPAGAPPAELVAAVLKPAPATAAMDHASDLTFSYSQRNPYSYAASNKQTRISIASQGKATIPFPEPTARYVYRKGYTGGSVLYATPPAKPANANPNRAVGGESARLALTAAYAAPPPAFQCRYAQRRHSTAPPPKPASGAEPAKTADGSPLPSVKQGQPRPVIAVHRVSPGNTHKNDQLHRGVSRNSSGGFYTS